MTSTIQANKMHVESYNVGASTQILTDISTDVVFYAIGLIMSRSDDVTLVGFGRKSLNSGFGSSSNMITESNGKVLFNPGEQYARLFAIVSVM